MQAYILAVDLTDKVSFINLKKHLLALRAINCYEKPILLVGTKVDSTSRAVITEEQLKQFAQQEGLLGPILTSAKENIRINETLECIATPLLKSALEEQRVKEEKNTYRNVLNNYLLAQLARLSPTSAKYAMVKEKQLNIANYDIDELQNLVKELDKSVSSSTRSPLDNKEVSVNSRGLFSSSKPNSARPEIEPIKPPENNRQAFSLFSVDEKRKESPENNTKKPAKMSKTSCIIF